MNKKAQLQSIALAVIMLFVVGILFFFFNHMFSQVYDTVGGYLEEGDYNNTEASTSIRGIEEAENAIWDYAGLAMAIGVVIQLVFFAFLTRISPVFYWVYLLASLIILALGAVLSNIWQDVVANPEFATTLTRFPITNTILGNSFLLFITSLVLMVIVIVTFGKGRGENE